MAAPAPGWLRDLLTGRGPMRLSTRIAVLSLGLLLLVQGAGFWAIRASIEGAARAQLARDLERGEAVWRDTLAHQADQISLAGRMAARDYGFQTTLFGGAPDAEAAHRGTPDADTVTSALESLVDRVGAELSAFVANDGSVRGIVAGAAPEADVRALAALLAAGRGTGGVRLVDGKPYHVVSVQILAPDRKGWLVIGYPVDRALLARLGELAGMDVAIVPSAGNAGGVLRSTLAPAAEAELSATAAGGALMLQGDAMQVRRIALGAADVLLLRSFSAAVAPYRQLQLLLALITLAGVAVFAVGSVLTARRVTTPLRTLAQASERLGRGEYGEPLTHQQRGDEIGDLAKAFDHMRLGIAAREAEVHQLAYFDKLTELPNRESFRRAVRQALDGPHEAALPFAVVMLNLNRFKPVNDALGYRLGDRLLGAVADRLRGQAMREGDLVARLGGDEFALLLPGIGEASAAAIVARVARAFEIPLTLDDQTVDLSAAFGIACWPVHGADADALLSRAEIAMHEAKRRTEPVLVYETAMDPDSATTLSLLSELRQAIERSELRLFLQPKFQLASGRLVGAEALVRWQHPARGMVPPAVFIPFAEKTGFVRQLTAWIFDDAARQWPALQAIGLKHVSVNLSARDLMDLELPQRLDAVLARRRVPAAAFCLEITESAIMDDPQRAQHTLQALKARGFALSIDDFGEGFTSLKHLRHLPVDELKVDGIFVKTMDRDPANEKIVRAVVDLAHNLGKRVVAEGVENEAVWEQLQAMGCDEAQGFHMCRPLPLHELQAFARRWSAARARARDAEPTVF